MKTEQAAILCAEKMGWLKVKDAEFYIYAEDGVGKYGATVDELTERYLDLNNLVPVIESMGPCLNPAGTLYKLADWINLYGCNISNGEDIPLQESALIATGKAIEDMGVDCEK